MLVMVEPPPVRGKKKGQTEGKATDFEGLITSMGKRIQAEYVEGAIPYLRKHEPELWQKLEELDREDSLEALLEYERLFFEGLHRYAAFLQGKSRAA